MAEIPTLVELPRDLALHTPAMAEIWYLTGFLDAGDRALGLQALITTSPSGWAFASLSLTDRAAGIERYALGRHRVDDIVVASDRLAFDNGAVRLTGSAEGLGLRATFDGVRVALELAPSFPPLYSCGAGAFPYFTGQTYQFAFPGLRATGEVEVDGGVLPAAGELWLDRQWSASRDAFGTAHGFTWFGIWLDDGSALSVWDTTGVDGSGTAWATRVSPDGTHAVGAIAPLATLSSGQQRGSESESASVQPARWVIDAPGLGTRLEVTHGLMHEESRFYCGLCQVVGSIGERPVQGRGVVDTVPA